MPAPFQFAVPQHHSDTKGTAMVRKPYSADLDFASAAHEPCEARVQFFARQLAELLETTHVLKRERDIARRQVRNLRAELERVRCEL